MYLEFIVGPVLALLVALKFGDMKDKEREKEITALREEVELIQADLPKKVMTTMIPVAKAVNKINQQLGLWTSKRPKLLHLVAGLRKI